MRELHIQKQQQKFLENTQKELKQLDRKIDTERNNLMIKQQKEESILLKKINLHITDIKRIQGFIKWLAKTKGETKDELRRTKERARYTNDELKQ